MDGFTVTPPELPGNANPHESHPRPPEAVAPCPSCGSREVTYRWRQFRDHTRHIHVTCAACGRHRQWAPRTPQAMAMALPQE
jgi:hypothetical protein